MKTQTFILTVFPDQANEIYSWCREQFGEEYQNWKYVFGWGYSYINGDSDHTYIISGEENIVLFELTWGEYKNIRHSL